MGMQVRARVEKFWKANIDVNMFLHYISHIRGKKNASSLAHLIPKSGYWFSSQLEFEIRI